jgi:hypothetical protein
MVMEKNMVQEFVNQNYLIIESNIVTNVVVWNGDTSTWTPPAGSLALIQATTPAMVWQAVYVDNKITDYILGDQVGAGSVGFTWDGTSCVTNEPKPDIPVQPTTTGTVNA